MKDCYASVKFGAADMPRAWHRATPVVEAVPGDGFPNQAAPMAARRGSLMGAFVISSMSVVIPHHH
ncbi:hypothetical protein GCM10009109_26480 [Marinobacterium sediminicola]